MKKLSKIKLCDVRIMNDQEMKRILGGQSSGDLCKMISGSGGVDFAGGTGSNNDDVVCSGECPTETVTGNTAKQTCQSDTQWINKKPITICMCK